MWCSVCPSCRDLPKIEIRDQAGSSEGNTQPAKILAAEFGGAICAAVGGKLTASAFSLAAGGVSLSGHGSRRLSRCGASLDPGVDLALEMTARAAAIGIEGEALGEKSVALEVAYRRREFAIRLALGSPGRSIVNGVLLRAGWLAAAGLVIGFGAALATSRALRSLLFGIAPLDAATYAAVLAIVLVAVGIAAWVPARRALLSDPHAVLREG